MCASSSWLLATSKDLELWIIAIICLTRYGCIFLTTLASKTNGKLPDNFVVMLPKVTIPEQITALVQLFEAIEANTRIPKNALKMEMMVLKNSKQIKIVN